MFTSCFAQIILSRIQSISNGNGHRLATFTNKWLGCRRVAYPSRPSKSHVQTRLLGLIQQKIRTQLFTLNLELPSFFEHYKSIINIQLDVAENT
jgi:hypothetical protein